MNSLMRGLVLLMAIILGISFTPKEPSLRMALLKYNGGGDWYANPTSLTNLALFCNSQINTNFDPSYATIEVGSPELFNYPFLHMTGHGNVVFSDMDAQNLKKYLIAGGFLHIDDNYGMDVFIRPAMKKVFPELSFIELPFTHGIYHQDYDFPNGLPKIHKHDDLPAQGFGLFWEDRLVCFYSFESDLGDGWEDESVHNDSPEKRLSAFQMGANIVRYSFSN